MRKMIFPLVAVAAALFAAGCTGPEQKLGRGLSNTFEIVRMGELRSSIEQNAILPNPGDGYYGFIHGVDRSLQRTGIGLIDVVTFPWPFSRENGSFYGPQFKDSFNPDPVFPESYKPDRLSDALFDTDTYTGFSGGDVAPWFPGSRFQVFDN